MKTGKVTGGCPSCVAAAAAVSMLCLAAAAAATRVLVPVNWV